MARPPQSDAADHPGSRLPLAARRHWFIAEVDRQLRVRGGLALGAKVVIGVSGGADSTALLLACVVIRARKRAGVAMVQPIAVHVHHHLRESADDDAAFLSELCRQFDVPLRIEHVKPAAMPGNRQANARRLRYDALAKVARSLRAPYVAVAHHGEDQLETILMSLCRGAGMDGLSGMSSLRPLGKGVTLLRPLLGVRRIDCESFCRAAGVQWQEDPGNFDPSQVRSRLRRDVLPVLEELWPDAASRATNAAAILEAARAALHNELQQSFGDPSRRRWARTRLERMPAAVIAAGLRRAAADELNRRGNAGAGLDAIGQRHLMPVAEAIRAADRRRRTYQWPAGLQVVVSSRRVKLLRDKHPRPAAVPVPVRPAESRADDGPPLVISDEAPREVPELTPLKIEPGPGPLPDPPPSLHPS